MKNLYEYYGLLSAVDGISAFNMRIDKVYSKLNDAKLNSKEDVNITLMKKEVNTLLASLEIANKVGKDFIKKIKQWDLEQEERDVY